jgi:hypothetical protein
MTKTTAVQAHALISRLEEVENRLRNWEQANDLNIIILLLNNDQKPNLLPTVHIRHAVVEHFRSLREIILQDLSELH